MQSLVWLVALLLSLGDARWQLAAELGGVRAVGETGAAEVVEVVAGGVVAGVPGKVVGKGKDDTQAGAAPLQPAPAQVERRRLDDAVDFEQWAKLVASDGAEGDWFGISLAIDGDRVVVGAFLHDTDGDNNRGAAYVHDVSSSGTLTEVAKLVASDGAKLDRFGISVAIDGDRVVVGAYNQDTDGDIKRGAAYVYDVSSRGTLTEVAKLVASDGAEDDWFGISVVIEGNRVVVGAYHHDTDGDNRRGAAYVYDVSSSGTLTEVAKLVASDGATFDRFGVSVDIDGDRVVVGAQRHHTDGDYERGAAYVYDVSSSGTLTEVAKLVASDGTVGDWFGVSVAIDGDRVVVGAEKYDTDGDLNRGAAYVYDISSFSSSGTLTEVAKLVASDGAANDWFGWSVAIDGDRVVVGAFFHDTDGDSNRGAAYVYDVSSSGTLTEVAKLVASDGAEKDRFGVSVAIDGDRVFVGADSHDTNGDFERGAAYVFVELVPTSAPTIVPTDKPTRSPTRSPTTSLPTTSHPTTSTPTLNTEPTSAPTISPTYKPTRSPTRSPTTSLPTTSHPTTSTPTLNTEPTSAPTIVPTYKPTRSPTTSLPTTSHPTTSTPTLNAAAGCPVLSLLASAACPDELDLPACDDLSLTAGDLCEGDGECTTSTDANNCGSSDVYRVIGWQPTACPTTLHPTLSHFADCPVLSLVPPDECPADLDLPACDDAALIAGNYCEGGDDDCGTSNNADNCGRGNDVYRVVVASTPQPTPRPTFKPMLSPTPTPPTPRPMFRPTFSPTTALPTACPDDPTWFKNGDPSKDCEWVGTLSSQRCSVRGADGRDASEACGVACGCPVTEPPTMPLPPPRPTSLPAMLSPTQSPSSKPTTSPLSRPTLSPSLFTTPLQSPRPTAKPTPSPSPPPMPSPTMPTSPSSHPTLEPTMSSKTSGGTSSGAGGPNFAVIAGGAAGGILLVVAILLYCCRLTMCPGKEPSHDLEKPASQSATATSAPKPFSLQGSSSSIKSQSTLGSEAKPFSSRQRWNHSAARANARAMLDVVLAAGEEIPGLGAVCAAAQAVLDVCDKAAARAADVDAASNRVCNMIKILKIMANNAASFAEDNASILVNDGMEQLGRLLEEFEVTLEAFDKQGWLSRQWHAIANGRKLTDLDREIKACLEHLTLAYRLANDRSVKELLVEQKYELETAMLAAIKAKAKADNVSPAEAADALADDENALDAIAKTETVAVVEIQAERARIRQYKLGLLESCEIQLSSIEPEPFAIGGQGQVHRGKFQGNVVAVKVVALHGASKEYRAKIMGELSTELAIMVKLQSPRVVQVFGVVTTDKDHIGMVMEYMAGDALRKRLDDLDAYATIDEAQRLVWCEQIARGMEYLYEKGVQHRDLKANNVLLGSDDACKIADFGLAKCNEFRTHMTSKTARHGPRGTSGFMAPELLGTNTFTEKADVYSYGLTCYEIATRDRPWSGLQEGQIYGKVVYEQARPDLPTTVPTLMIELIKTCWCQEPDARPTFAEVVASFFVNGETQSVASLGSIFKRALSLSAHGSTATRSRPSTPPRLLSHQPFRSASSSASSISRQSQR